MANKSNDIFLLKNVSNYANINLLKYTVSYYHPRVKEEIESWPVCVLADFARLLELLMEYGPNLRMPHSKTLGGGLFELRPRGKEGIGRVFFCFIVEKRIIVLHAFIKKSKNTPDRDLNIARKRMKEVKNG